MEITKELFAFVATIATVNTIFLIGSLAAYKELYEKYISKQ